MSFFTTEYCSSLALPAWVWKTLYISSIDFPARYPCWIKDNYFRRFRMFISKDISISFNLLSSSIIHISIPRVKAINGRNTTHLSLPCDIHQWVSASAFANCTSQKLSMNLLKIRQQVQRYHSCPPPSFLPIESKSFSSFLFSLQAAIKKKRPGSIIKYEPDLFNI